MSEKDLDQLLDQLGRDRIDVYWAGPELVRHRGRQLAVRRMVITGVTALLVLAVTAGTGLALLRSDAGPVRPAVTTSAPGSPAPTATSDASPSPAPSAARQQLRRDGDPIPLRAMLQPEDLGDGWREIVIGGTSDFFDAPYRPCEPDGLDLTAAVQHRSREFSAGQGSVVQAMHAYSSGDAGARWLADLHAAIERCQESGRVSIVDRGFAGPGSFLVRTASSDPRYWSFVRRGDVITEVSPEKSATESRARTLTFRAAERMTEMDAIRAVPRAVLLEPGDLGTGYRIERERGSYANLSVRLGRCDRDWPLEPDRLVADRKRTFTNPGSTGTADWQYHSVMEVDAEAAIRHLAGIRALLPRCARFTFDNYFDTTMEVVDQRFAGADALLIKIASTYPGQPTSTAYFVIVRQGAHLIELELIDPQAARARSLARTAVQRLCVATEAC